MASSDWSASVSSLLAEMGVVLPTGNDLSVRTPIDGSELARLPTVTGLSVNAAVLTAQDAFVRWREIPPPRRGEFVRRYAEQLRRHRSALATLVSIETGKIRAEGLGEVQEMIDICDFACGLSRQLYGLTMGSERPGHRLMETWHPLGVCGVISAFNFPAAVWAWNASLAWVCGNAVVWKPSEKAPLTALACQALLQPVFDEMPDVPTGVSQVLIGGADVAQAIADDARVPLVSATGSTRMGRVLAPRIAARFGRALLELGGNNGMIVAPSADLDLAVRAIVFSAAGTAGQRCTSLRRLFVHESVRDALMARLHRAFSSLNVGDPFAEGVLVGPLIDAAALAAQQDALAEARADGGKVTGGERVPGPGGESSFYVRPAIVEMGSQTAVVRRETFAPILYVLSYADFSAALAAHNDVPQGLASSLFSNDLRETERFLGASGSDCGIANINVGPSGAEIGGAFGGDKETGGGRESGTDAWKSYMRRATNTINQSSDLPLAQGVRLT